MAERKKLPKEIQDLMDRHGLQERDAAFPPTWKPKAGEKLFGKVLAYKPQTGPNKQDLVTIRNEEGKSVSFWLTVDAQGKVTPEDVGKTVLIYYEGQAKNPKSGRMMHVYRILFP